MPLNLSITPNPHVPFKVVYEDHHLLALYKPPGVVTQPGQKHPHDSLLNGAFVKWGKSLQNLGKKRDFGLLHRLDRGTSGLVLIALTHECYDGLRSLFARREIVKRYWAIVHGRPSPPDGHCDLDIAEVRVEGHKRAQVVVKSNEKRKIQRRNRYRTSQNVNRFCYQPRRSSLIGQQAVTHYQTVITGGDHRRRASLLVCEIQTGRLHQIRVHLNAMGAPVVGDFDYGGKRPLNLVARKLGRGQHALHAGFLELTHPCLGTRLQLHVPVSPWFQKLAEQLNISLPDELLD